MTVILIVAGILVLLLVGVIWGLTPYVAIRRKDCCGKGCGCLFPVNKPPISQRPPPDAG